MRERGFGAQTIGVVTGSDEYLQARGAPSLGEFVKSTSVTRVPKRTSTP